MRYRAVCVGVFLAGLLALAPAAPAQVSVWFRANFDSLGSTNMYNFANRFPQSATTWTTDHRATGGWNGSGAAHVVVQGCSAATGRPCNTSENQFNVGWQTPTLPAHAGEFIRFRVKFDPGTVFTTSSLGAKFILHGSSGSNRWIIHLYPPYMNNGCTLGFESYNVMGWTPPASQWHQAAHWGLPAFSRSGGPYGGFTPNVNISWSCAPAVLVHGSDVAAVKTQNHGAAPAAGWYHLQFQAIPGTAGSSGLRSWANNNAQNTPSAEHLNMGDALSPADFTQGVYVGGYWGIGQSRDVGFTIDDFEVGPTFDPAWFPGGTTPPTEPPPTGCETTIAPTSRTMTAAAQTFGVTVTASASTCTWTATSAASWLTLSRESGTGSGSVVVTAAENTVATARTGTVTIAGQTVTVNQNAATTPPVEPPTGPTETCIQNVVTNSTPPTVTATIVPCPGTTQQTSAKSKTAWTATLVAVILAAAGAVWWWKAGRRRS